MRPALGRWPCEHGLHELLTDALRSGLQHNTEAEKTPRLEILALSYVLSPPMAFLESSRRWAATAAWSVSNQQFVGDRLGGGAAAVAATARGTFEITIGYADSPLF